MRESSKIKETPGQVLLGTFNKISLSIVFVLAKLLQVKRILKNLNALFCLYIVFRRRSAKKAAKVRKGSSSQCRCYFYEGAVVGIDDVFVSGYFRGEKI